MCLSRAARTPEAPPGQSQSRSTVAGIAWSLVLAEDELSPRKPGVLPVPGEQLALRGHDLLRVDPVEMQWIVGERILLTRDRRVDLLVLALHVQLPVREPPA